MPAQSLGDQLRRVWELIDLLPTERTAVNTATLYQIGRQQYGWQTTERTIHRDLQALKDLGIAACKRLDPWRRDKNAPLLWYRTEAGNPQRPMLSPAQAIALTLLRQLGRQLLPKEVIDDLQPQLDAADHYRVQRKNMDDTLRWSDKVAVIPSGIATRPPALNPRLLAIAQNALLRDQVVEANYRASGRGQAKTYRLEPRALVQRGATLYMVATQPDYPSRKPAWYAMHRFVELRLLKTKFKSTSFDLAKFIADGGANFAAPEQAVTVRLKITDRIQALLIESPLGNEQQFTKTTDGLVATASVRPGLLLRNWLMTYADEATVLEPEDLREEMAARLREASAAYR